MKVLVTGSTGFIGFHTTARLVAAGHQVRVLVRDAEKAQRTLETIGVDPAEFVVGDMTDESAVARALEGQDAIVHTAASVSIGGGDPAAMLRDNVRGTELIVGGAVERGAKFVVYVSSMTALFDPRRPSITLESPIAESRSAYGKSKAACERIVQRLLADGAPLSIVYPGGVIGPDDPGFSESVYSYRGFCRQLLATSGGVSQIDVRDLAELMARLIDRGQAGRVLAPGHYLSWQELARAIEDTTGATPKKLAIAAPLLRGMARLADVVNRARGTTSQFSGEGITIATLLPETRNSPDIADLGIELRAPDRTLEDMYRWLLGAGKLPERAVPKLADATSS